MDWAIIAHLVFAAFCGWCCLDSIGWVSKTRVIGPRGWAISAALAAGGCGINLGIALVYATLPSA